MPEIERGDGKKIQLEVGKYTSLAFHQSALFENKWGEGGVFCI